MQARFSSELGSSTFGGKKEISDGMLLGGVKSPRRDASMIKVMFAGDSTMYYTCKVFATVLSNYKLKMHTPKFTQDSEHHDLENTFNFTSTKGNQLSVNCVRSRDKLSSTSPSGQASLLKKELDQMKNGLQSSPAIYVLGDSNAHSLCHGSEKQVLSGTEKLIRVAKELLMYPGVRIVWVAPGFVGKSFNILAQRLHKKQIALWKSHMHGVEESFSNSFVLIEQWQMTGPVFYELSRDGVHYHAVLGPSRPHQEKEAQPYACDRYIDGRAPSGNNSLGCYSGPVPIYITKIMVNALLHP